jgi:hypothetical protein
MRRCALLNRRTFLSTASLATLGLPAARRFVAGEGGPVRKKPLAANYWGTQYYDEKEQEQLLEVHRTQLPFRWYGFGDRPPMKVTTLNSLQVPLILESTIHRNCNLLGPSMPLPSYCFLASLRLCVKAYLESGTGIP